MSEVLVKRIDFLLGEGIGKIIAKAAFVATVPTILKFIIDLIKSKTTRKLDATDVKMYYSTMNRKIKQELSNKGFYQTDTTNNGRTAIYTHKDNRELKIQIHYDEDGKIIRVGALGAGRGMSMKAPTLKAA